MLFQKTPQWLLVFLGNPGGRYDGTRHNVGFAAADCLAGAEGISVKRLKFHALTAAGVIAGVPVLLMKPQTYMNLSGEAVKPAADFYKIPPENILVVGDDISLAPGKLRIRRHGSAGGHNGLKSIISHLGTEAFPRLKIGVGGPPHPDYDVADWVLGKFRSEEKVRVEQAIRQAAAAVKTILCEGVDAAMNAFN